MTDQTKHSKKKALQVEKLRRRMEYIKICAGATAYSAVIALTAANDRTKTRPRQGWLLGGFLGLAALAFVGLYYHTEKSHIESCEAFLHPNSQKEQKPYPIPGQEQND